MVKQLTKIIGILTILFLVGIASISFASQERKPVGDPIPPKDKPMEPDCPTEFGDSFCEMSGSSFGHWANEVWGAAAIICDGKKADCETSQGNEFYNNQAICESVKGCKLTAVTEFTPCGFGSSNKKDCSPKPGLIDNTPYVIYYCTVKGKYDITDYECERPEA